MRRPLVIGNWKMNGDRVSNQELLRALAAQWQSGHSAEMLVCPSFPYIEQAVHEVAGSEVLVGGQDVSHRDPGAFTGDVSAAMLVDLGCRYVIVGHSERRRYHGESDALVADKVDAAWRHNVIPIICVGETIEQREEGKALAVIERQLRPNLARLTPEQLAESVIAYEPLWAIGTGRTATPDQAQEVHAYIREQLGSAARKTRVIYGGSVKPENAEALFAEPDIDGALVGGASLKAESFLAICRAADMRGTREI